MASLTKTKVMHSVKLKRGSARSTTATDRTGLKIQEIPPELCHLTGDALAAPFPPIAPGGYIKYYKIHHECEEQYDTRGVTGLDWKNSDNLGGAKRKRRASSASTLLGPLLSHTPKPWPSHEVPSKSHLFHTRPSTSPESPPSPVSPSSPPLTPQSRKRRFLSVIHEVSRETMRSDMDDSAKSLAKPRKLRVVSLPPPLPTPTNSFSLGASALALSLITPPRSPSGNRPMSFGPLSPTGSLRRKKRQILRTPSVENDFARHAREMLGLSNDNDEPPAISRENSSGSETTEEESLLSPAMSVNTAITSLLEPSSLHSSPSSHTKVESRDSGQPHDSEIGSNVEIPARCASSSPDPAPPGAFPHPQIKSPAKSGSYQSIGSEISSQFSDGSPTISTPPTSIGGCHVGEDKRLQDLVVMEVCEEDDEEKRDSWASYETAKSSLDPPSSPPSVAVATTEISPDDDLKQELAASIQAFQALVALSD